MGADTSGWPQAGHAPLGASGRARFSSAPPLDDRLRLEERSVGFASLLLNLYGRLALLLAGIGVYGVLAATVAARLRELGIRAALGAAPRRLQLAIVRQGLLVTLSAIALGVLMTAALSSSLRALFFDTSPVDPRALGVAAMLLGVTASAASLIPARRASRVDAIRVLKVDG
jgi:putative ABC transport system permease protein